MAVTKTATAGLSNDIWVRLMGGRPSYGPVAMPGPNQGRFRDNGGQGVNSPSDLSCDFEGDCCWTQEKVSQTPSCP